MNNSCSIFFILIYFSFFNYTKHMKYLIASFSIILFFVFAATTRSANAPHYVGESFGGGLVVYVECSNDLALDGMHGLIAAKTDVPFIAGEPLGLTYDEAVAGCAAFTAGGNGGGLGVWHLPIKEELFRLCCKAHHVPGGILTGLLEDNHSNDKTRYYWSSTTSTAGHVWEAFMWNASHSGGNFGSAETHHGVNSLRLSARAVRTF